MLAPPRPRSIRVAPGPLGDGFDVEIVPPFDDGANFDQHHSTYRQARGYAGGLRMVLGLPLIDLCEEAEGG